MHAQRGACFPPQQSGTEPVRAVIGSNAALSGGLGCKGWIVQVTCEIVVATNIHLEEPRLCALADSSHHAPL